MSVSREKVNGKRLQTFALVDDFLEPRAEGIAIGKRSGAALSAWVSICESRDACSRVAFAMLMVSWRR